MNTSLKINVAGESLQSQFLGLPTRRMLVISLTKFVNNLQLERKKKDLSDSGHPNSCLVYNTINRVPSQDSNPS